MSFIGEILRNLENAVLRRPAESGTSGRFRAVRDRKIDGLVYARAGQILFQASVHDYGMADADTQAFGRTHLAVSGQADGGYPLFTIPEEDVEAISAASLQHRAA